MKERSIIFSAPMVRAILDGRKTQERRIVKLTDSGRVREVGSHRNWHLDDPDAVKACPYGAPGDRLWVREAWHSSPHFDCLYRADYDANAALPKVRAHGGWRPSIHMSRSASRITLEVTGVRVQRVQEISKGDAKAEGVSYNKHIEGYGVEGGNYFHCTDPRRSYEKLWDQINGPGSWDANPWVWVIEFRRITERE